MKKLSVDQIVEINLKIQNKKSEKYDPSIIENILQDLYSKDNQGFYIYRDTAAKAAKLACEISSNKPFDSANNRTAVLSAFILMRANGITLQNYMDGIKEFLCLVKDNKVDIACTWLKDHYIDRYAIIE